MIRIEYVVLCDECGAVYDWREFDSKSQALHTVRSEGWLGSYKRLICNQCAEGI